MPRLMLAILVFTGSMICFRIMTESGAKAQEKNPSGSQVLSILSTADNEMPRQSNLKSLDLTSFPKLHGRLVRAIGRSMGYSDPEIGDSCCLDLSQLKTIQSIEFGDKVRPSSIPFPTLLSVLFVNYDDYGVFEGMRLRSTDNRNHTVTIDINARKYCGHTEQRVDVWILVEQKTIYGVFYICFDKEGEFPLCNRRWIAPPWSEPPASDPPPSKPTTPLP